MRSLLTPCLLALFTTARAQSPAFEPSTRTPQFIAISDPNGAEGTLALAINSSGTIVGSYTDSNQNYHSFLRTAQGVYTTIDPPGSISSGVSGIDAAGNVVGSYDITNHYTVGFIRSPAGVFTNFQVPGGQVNPRAISGSGVIIGYYVEVNDPNNVAHGFVRAIDGTITIFDAPGAGTGPGFGLPLQHGTFPNAINQAGTVSGYFNNIIGSGRPTAHGFLRAVDGTFTTYDVPGAGVGAEGDGTFPQGIDKAGDVAGYWTKLNGGPTGESCFLRTADGTLTSFAVAGAGNSGFAAISPSGEVIGSATLPNSPDGSVGFARSVGGKITFFSYPGAFSTEPVAVNASGATIGFYDDNNSFLLVP